MRLLHFATNRLWDRMDGTFGFVPEDPPDRLWLGTVKVGVSADPLIDGKCSPPDVSGFDDFAGPAGRDGAAMDVLAGWFAVARARDALPLLYVHGFDYDFGEACARAGNLCDWLEASGELRLEPLAFTWPSNGITGSSAYKDDQKDCAASGPALARLIHAIGKAAAGHAGRKPAYLAHSMGARATRFAMEALAIGAEALPERLFGQAIVIAGDDDTDVLTPPRAPLRPIAEIADWVTLGVYPGDATLAVISEKVENRKPRLGADGPGTVPHPDDRIYVVDYAYAVSAKPEAIGTTEWNYVAHQYYRNDPRVRKDLVQALSGVAPELVAGRHWGKPDPAVGLSEKAGRLYVV
ncbi:alpha/beta hydrolase [Neoroseomonas soli]|uniref:Alpha/beta hydrolase n=1 Tax=Neoroseomonas soli TaxID=1081025 RepID=A0A9X9WUT5_9PROT|nr:alpha/beta hydrolase [Neoroseomonas soli]MBR0670914.1 alpha/beta hydrolase [Neoroseomonas soli]